MSQGAVFKLVLRDERFDKFFTASDHLRRRLAAVRAARTAAGEADPAPTFADVERTHLLYVRASYRPYVAVASEYTRVKPSGDGAAALGASGGAVVFTFPTYGHFTSDMALHVRFAAAGSATAAAADEATPYLRYCALPGLRLLRRVELRSDAVLIDDYDRDDAVAYSKFFVPADRRAGWERCHGQQELREASFFGNGFTGSLMYRDGPQTPKLYQPAFDVFIPLQFWFGRGAEHALLNDLVPNSQRTVTCELAPLSEMMQALVPDAGYDVIDDPADGITPRGLVPAALPFARHAISVDLYVNSLYVSPEIHDIFARRVGFSLIRAHRRQTSQLQSAAGSFLLDQLKFPAEYLLVGLRRRSLAADFDRWWMMGEKAARTGANKLLTPAIVWNAAVGGGVSQLVVREAVEASTLESFTESLGVTAHGIEIFPLLPAAFYNAYAPLRGGSMVVSPVDTSAHLVSFCLYPGRFNPSGYYNLSAGREMYINYTLKPAYESMTSGEAEMVISMSALNFLMRRGDRLQLRYAM